MPRCLAGRRPACGLAEANVAGSGATPEALDTAGIEGTAPRGVMSSPG